MALDETTAAVRTSWEGGLVRYGADGRGTFVIRRMVNGNRYMVSTRVRFRADASEQAKAKAEAAALIQLRRFEANPEGYDPRGEVAAAPIYLDDPLRLAFLLWSAKPKKEGGKGNTRDWVHEQKLYLEWWQKKLDGVNLRRPSFQDHIRPALDGAKSYRARVAVILALYRWLRLERGLELSEDPVHGRFYLSDPEPEQWKKLKAVPREHFERALEHLTGIYRDVLILQGGTGCHVTEAWRFMQRGSIEPLPKNSVQDGSAGVVVFPLTKGKDVLRVRVDARTLAAAEEVLDYGRKSGDHVRRKAFSKERYADAVKAACTAGEVPVFKPGQMRHSLATAAVNAGADLSAVAAFLGHKSLKTTRRFYATFGAVRRVPTLTEEPAPVSARTSGKGQAAG